MGNTSVTMEGRTYYSPRAYRPDALPDLPDQEGDANRSKLGRTGSIRLPWGNTQEVVPVSILSHPSPRMMRKFEREGGDLLARLGKEDIAGKMDHECLRFVRLAFRFNAINFLEPLAKVAFWSFLPVSILTFLLMWYAVLDQLNFLEALIEARAFFFMVLGIPALLWLFATLMCRLFPNWLLKTGRGPEWEINRRTGLVTVWTYPKKVPFRKQGTPTVTQAPFYEFDGWVNARTDRHGVLNSFVMYHRYRKLLAPVGDILGNHSRPHPCYAHWDFLQNYMDITKPLPDIPKFEKYRYLDPVTAEYDRKTGRPERYWRDMDDKSFKEKVEVMRLEVNMIDTESRPNLMAEKVRYSV